MRRVLGFLFALLLNAQVVLAGAPRASSLEWHLTLVGAPSAWSVGADGRGVRVLVIDSGLDATMAQSDFAGSLGKSMTVTPLKGSVRIGCPNGEDSYGKVCHKDVLIPNPDAYRDDMGHGSFVACEISCHDVNYHYYGIAPRALVSMAKVFAPNSTGDDGDIAQAIRWGGLYRFPIISMSLGSAMPDPVEAAAIQYAQARGSIIVAASGNSAENGPGIDFPAGYHGVISVGATDRFDQRASFSQYGYDLTISAPGDYIFGIAPMHPTSIQTGGLATWPGTSMATPLVAGALADLMSVGLDAPQARMALLGGARHWPGMDHEQYGVGILDLNGALRYAHTHHFLRS